MATFQNNEEAVVLYLQDHIYDSKRKIMEEEKRVELLENEAKEARSMLEYDRKKLKTVCMWLTDLPDIDTDYVEALGIFGEE